MKHTVFISNRSANFLVLGTMFVVLIPTLALMNFSEPVADDFARAAVVDVPRYIAWNYLHWSGRWAGNGLEAFLLSRLPMLSSYSSILWALHFAHFLGLLAFWQMLLGSAVTLRSRLGLALGFFVFLLAGYPDPGEIVYWVTGAIEYQLPVSLALLFLAILDASTRSPLRPARALPLAAALGLLGFTITGFHELVALMLLGALFTGTLLALEDRRPNLGIWLFLLIVVALGTAVSVLAPGNTERAATDYVHGRSVSQAIPVLAKALIRVLRWIDLKLVAASVLLALTVHSQVRPRQNPSDRARIRAWAIPLAGATMLVANCTVIGYVTGGAGPARVQDLFYLAFCIVWFTSLVVLLQAVPGFFDRLDHSTINMARTVSACLLCVSLLTSTNIGSEIHDLVFNALDWRRAMANRYEFVQQAARSDEAMDVIVPPVSSPATFYRGLDLGPDADFIGNRVFAAYFGIRSVRVGRSFSARSASLRQ